MQTDTMTPPDAESVLKAAARLLRRRDKLNADLRELDDQLRGLGQQYNRAMGLYGTRPEHLAHACRARGLRLD